MFEIEQGYQWDVGYNGDKDIDIIYIDTGEVLVALTMSDLQDMLSRLSGEEND